MNNIFENAYFGKPYKTRGEEKALYHCFDGQYHRLFTEERCEFSPYCDDNGKHLTHSEEESRFDIVSEWQEPINEEELDELAINCPFHDNDNLETAYFMGFKAGANYKHNSDMKKLKSVLNSLMVDTRDKVAIFSLMEELQ